MWMTGGIKLRSDAANKGYVDDAIARAFFAPVDCTPGVNVALTGTGSPIWDGVAVGRNGVMIVLDRPLRWSDSMMRTTRFVSR